MSTNAEINSLLGQKIKDLRMQRKLTREIFAERIDVSSRFLASVESGQVGVSLSTLKKICLELGVSADTLLGISNIPEDDSTYTNICNKIKQLDKSMLQSILEIVTSFSNAVNLYKQKNS